MLPKEIYIFLQDVTDELQVVIEPVKGRDLYEFEELLFGSGQLNVKLFGKLFIGWRDLHILLQRLQQMHWKHFTP